VVRRIVLMGRGFVGVVNKSITKSRNSIRKRKRRQFVLRLIHVLVAVMNRAVIA
jgi:hypothetical protein